MFYYKVLLRSIAMFHDHINTYITCDYLYVFILLGKGWQYVWGKGSQSYSEMIIKSYICKHRSSDNDLAPVSVALIHRFGTVTVNLSSMEVRKFRDQIREGGKSGSTYSYSGYVRIYVATQIRTD